LTLGGIGGGLGGGSTSIDGGAFSAALTRIKTIKSDKIMFSCVQARICEAMSRNVSRQ